MANLNEIHKCSLCGALAEVVVVGAGKLVCCGKNMELLKENTQDAAIEKHVPVVSKDENIVTVKVGEVEHPMEEKHYIRLIEILVENRVYRVNLKPGDKPEAKFSIPKGKEITVREECNLHGLWKA